MASGRLSIWPIVLVTVLLLVPATAASAAPPSPPPPSSNRAAPEYIGTATMLPDRTIVLSLASYDDRAGAIAHAEFTYAPDHPQYAEILRHLGDEMRPGEKRLVPPWPDTP